MGDTPLSPDDSQEPNDYENILDRVLNDDRDRDEEVATSVRLTEWQDAAINEWRGGVNTNRVELLNALFIEGTKILRDCGAMDKANHILELKKLFSWHALDQNEWTEKYGDRFISTSTKGYEFGYNYDNVCDEPDSLYVPESLYSEVKRVWKDDLMLLSGIYRSIISVGILKMDGVPAFYQTKCQDIKDSLENYVGKAVREIEKLVSINLLLLFDDFSEQLAEDEHLSWVKEIQEKMKTSEVERVERVINRLEENYV